VTYYSKPYDYNGTPADCRPVDGETVIEIISGPNRYNQYSFFAYWNNPSPAYCGRCGKCTNPDNVKSCGHPEADFHVRGQIFFCNLEDYLKQHPHHRIVDRRRAL